MFSHLCERYFSDDQDIGVIDRMIEGALRTLVDIGADAVHDLGNYDHRAQIMWISTIAQNNTLGIGRKQDWSTHTIANEISALYHTAHGATLSIIMGSWMRVASSRSPERFARYARTVFDVHASNDKDAAVQGIDATERFFLSMDMPISFEDLHLPTDGVERMLKNIAFNGEDRSIGAVARLNRDDCRLIYTMALARSSRRMDVTDTRPVTA